jgi:hypothetical protein
VAALSLLLASSLLRLDDDMIAVRRAPQFLVVIADEVVLKQTPAEHKRDSNRDAANSPHFMPQGEGAKSQV